MNKDKKILKDIEYYQEIAESVRETEDFDEFKKYYKEHKIQKTEQSVTDAYLTNVTYDLYKAFDNNFSSSNTTSIKDREILSKMGNYLNTLEILRERIDLNNTTTSKKDPLLMYKVNNPFFVTTEQMKKEFDMVENKNNSECEVCSKNMFWINKSIKTVKGLRNGRQTEYAKSNKLNNKVFRNILDNVYYSKEIRT